ncbi:hypothetical protein B566_EDAN018021, partial [Ephemera danica]
MMHFETVEFFLMPYPGKEVDRNQKFDGEINEIELVFLGHMTKLVEYLIANVKPKKLLGKEVNGEHLVPVLEKYVEYLNKGLLPVPKSLIKLQMELSEKEAERECIKVYNFNMREKTKEKYLNQDKMEKLHGECVTEAIVAFDTLPDFGNQNQIDTVKKDFSKSAATSAGLAVVGVGTMALVVAAVPVEATLIVVAAGTTVVVGAGVVVVVAV